MKFYDLSKEERKQKYMAMQADINHSIHIGELSVMKQYFDDMDAYTRKAAYLGVGKIYENFPELIENIIYSLNKLYDEESERIRQTVIYSCGEIAVYDFEIIKNLLKVGMVDAHHCVRNAVIGSLKKVGEKNPKEILAFCDENIISSNKEVRRIVCHGLELRGREYPQDIIHILKKLQYEKIKKVKDMLIHVLGQISYKQGCLYYVSNEVKSWDNKEIYPLYKQEVIEVHGRYEKFSEFSQTFVLEYFAMDYQKIL